MAINTKIKRILGVFAKSKKPTPKELDIKTGERLTYVGYNVGDTIYQDHEAEALLTELRNATSVGDKIEIIADKDPDVSQAVWAFQRLCMQGIKVEITDLNGTRLNDIEEIFREECKSWNPISNDGLDGLIDSFNKTGLLYNIIMVEVVVNSSANEEAFEGIYLVDPRTVEWQLEEIDGKKQWIPYQDQDGNKVNLTEGNIIWVSVNPGITTPTGAYLLEPAIPAVDYKLQTIKDSSAVLRRQGYPYNIFSINKERVLNTMPAALRNDKREIKRAIDNAISLATSAATNREPTQDIVVTDDITIDKSSNASAGSSIDVRAWFDTIDIQMLNGCKTLGILMNRNSGSTESWGTVQMKLITDMVHSFQSKTKRLIEQIGAMWLQLKGIQGTITVTHNPIDYQSEKQKWESQNEKDLHFQLAENQGWINIDEAAQGAIGAEKATGNKENSSNNQNNNSNNSNNNSNNNNSDNNSQDDNEE